MSSLLVDLVVINEYEYNLEYIDSLRRQGKTSIEIIECLKEYMKSEIEKRKLGYKE